MIGERLLVSAEATSTAAYQKLPWYDVARCRAEALRQRLPGATPAKTAGPFLAISRLPGAGGGEIAERLGDALRWPVLGRQLLDRIARRFHVDPSLLELLDETPTNLLYEALGHLLNSELISQNAYLSYLRKIVRAAAAEGPTIFVGRGAQFFLPPGSTLRIRVVADEADRVERLQRRFQLPHLAAARLVREREKSRAAFIDRYFHRDLNDPAAYDLVVNSSGLGIDGCVEAILAALGARTMSGAPRRRGLSPRAT